MSLPSLFMWFINSVHLFLAVTRAMATVWALEGDCWDLAVGDAPACGQIPSSLWASLSHLSSQVIPCKTFENIQGDNPCEKHLEQCFCRHC